MSIERVTRALEDIRNGRMVVPVDSHGSRSSRSLFASEIGGGP